MRRFYVIINVVWSYTATEPVLFFDQAVWNSGNCYVERLLWKNVNLTYSLYHFISYMPRFSHICFIFHICNYVSLIEWHFQHSQPLSWFCYICQTPFLHILRLWTYHHKLGHYVCNGMLFLCAELEIKTLLLLFRAYYEIRMRTDAALMFTSSFYTGFLSVVFLFLAFDHPTGFHFTNDRRRTDRAVCVQKRIRTSK